MSDTVGLVLWLLTSAILVFAAGVSAYLAGRRRYFLSGVNAGWVLVLWASVLKLALS